MGNLIFKKDMQIKQKPRRYRLFYIMWEPTRSRHGRCPIKLTVSLQPSLFGIRRYAWAGWAIVILGIRIHYSRSHNRAFL